MTSCVYNWLLSDIKSYITYHFFYVTNCAMLFRTSMPWFLSISARHLGSPLDLAIKIAALFLQFPVRSLAIKTSWAMDYLNTVSTCYFIWLFSERRMPNKLQVLQNKFSFTRLDLTKIVNDLNRFSGILVGDSGFLMSNKTFKILTIWTMYFSSGVASGSCFKAILSKVCIHFVKFLLDSYLNLPITSNPR